MDGRALVGRSCTTLQFCFTVKVESVQMSFSFVAQNCPFRVSLLLLFQEYVGKSGSVYILCGWVFWFLLLSFALQKCLGT